MFTGSLADEIETDGFAPPMPRGGAFTARCIATLPRLGKWICHGDVRPAGPDTNGVRRFLRLGRVMGVPVGVAPTSRDL